MAEKLDWLYPPAAAERYPEAAPPIAIRGTGEDWSVIRCCRVEAPEAPGRRPISEPIAAEFVIYSGLRFEEARQRAGEMLAYLAGPRNTQPPSWD
jgi:hypothetical protein